MLPLVRTIRTHASTWYINSDFQFIMSFISCPLNIKHICIALYYRYIENGLSSNNSVNLPIKIKVDEMMYVHDTVTLYLIKI